MFWRQHKSLESETALLQRAAAWPDHATVGSLDPETLRHLTKSQSVDFATALLFDRFQKSPGHAPFIQRINAFRRDTSSAYPALHVKVVIVPGALYVERPEMGGDGRLVREVAARFNCETDLIPLVSFGAVGTNARLIRTWFEQHPNERVILVSLSKGGLDLKSALTATDAASTYRNVIAWVNVCGPLNGSRMADWILASRWRTGLVRAKCRWQRRDFQLIADLRHSSHGSPEAAPRPPATMRLYNLVGFPFQRHMTTPFSRFCHRILTGDGPSDGTISLSDLSAWPGEIFPAWGMDHYFRPESEARRLITAMFRYLAEEFPSYR